MIRFQICIFDTLNTAHTYTIKTPWSCDSLSNLYLWHIKYSRKKNYPSPNTVVIRFQICIFDTLNTAFTYTEYSSGSCDSLSNLYLWHIKYSRPTIREETSSVVIRFQICIFDTLNTARKREQQRRAVLWFAFKFVSLTH